ncbi:MAG: hypothetical protein ABF991_11250 [Liquorilactobacillus hordei]|uniref:DUF2178 domain-containing protein n=1 Tax=Liquorilactobacillus hordei TaxID=468911 RepID=A0A3Q8CAR8_9LACO|nr:hypothetical protein [Liquorilactobacillus hordei]AUJ30742.1 hypothetical protein BSQ49_11435 [Liquorilactobacillus hordei]
MISILSGWLIETTIGILVIGILSFFVGKKPISQKKVEELEFLIRIKAITFSWIGLMMTLAFSAFGNFFDSELSNYSRWDPIFYIGLSLILYMISYFINKRKYS